MRKLLNPKDQHYIVAHLVVGASLRAKLNGSAPPVHLSIEEAREIRNAATKRLAAVGFDAVDAANSEGRYLETLIERLSPI